MSPLDNPGVNLADDMSQQAFLVLPHFDERKVVAAFAADAQVPKTIVVCGFQDSTGAEAGFPGATIDRGVIHGVGQPEKGAYVARQSNQVVPRVAPRGHLHSPSFLLL